MSILFKELTLPILATLRKNPEFPTNAAIIIRIICKCGKCAPGRLRAARI